MGNKIYKMIQHRSQKKHLNKEMRDFVSEHHPEIEDEDMVEIVETRSLHVNNTWKP